MARVTSVRLTLVAVMAVLCLGVAACGSKSGHTGASGNIPAANSVPGAGCQHVDSVKFDKTKFVLHGGLGFGAFHHWIYKPYKVGAFHSGAKGRMKALLKAAAAGAFTVHELKIAKQDAESSPTLCKVVAPLDKAEATLSGMSGSLKSGKVKPADLQNANTSVGAAQQGAGKAGVQVNDRVPTSAQLASAH